MLIVYDAIIDVIRPLIVRRLIFDVLLMSKCPLHIYSIPRMSRISDVETTLLMPKFARVSLNFAHSKFAQQVRFTPNFLKIVQIFQRNGQNKGIFSNSRKFNFAQPGSVRILHCANLGLSKINSSLTDSGQYHEELFTSRNRLNSVLLLH